MPDDRHDYDALVLGGGPAGLAAALWLARHRRRVAVLDGGEPRNRTTSLTHGYLGHDPISPTELLERARTEVLAYPTSSFLPCLATGARAHGEGGFEVDTDEGERLSSRRLVLATGVVDELPPVAGVEEHYGESVFHCPTCDGYEARDREVVVLGWGAQIAGTALELFDWARRVTVVTGGRPFEGDERHREALARHGVSVKEVEAAELSGRRGELRGVLLSDGTEVACDVVFFSVAHHPRTELARELGCRLTEEGCVEVDDQCRTSVSGVFAAGDVTPGLQIVQVATAEGAVAGVACALSLQGEPPLGGGPAPAPDVASEVPQE
ncbi:MAG TPA: NAD(P)/FAD-dependent oxidoreductase [Acidimicrobiales bacterium]|nr:NAD(P)/FAD-dependent oxidoreductase [Acidimicrobiales bacterium]